MEVVTFSVLSAFIVQALCLVSYIYYKRYKSETEAAKKAEEEEEKRKNEERKAKLDMKKVKRKKAPVRRKRVISQDLDESDTESHTTEDQLAQVIMKEEFIKDSINMTAVNAKPTIKKFAAQQVTNSKNHKSVKKASKPLNRFETISEDLDWESVTNRKHKKKIETSNPREYEFSFVLDEEGGIAEIPFCEIHFPGESVTKPMTVTLQIEKYKKFVDDTEEKVFLTPAVHFVTSGDSKLKRRFTLHLNTMRMMGRGWDGTVCGQIETREEDGTWNAFGRVEYAFGKPIQIVHDTMSSFRVVITRGQNGSITRSLSVSAFIQKSKMQNPYFHVIHLCVYDKSSQSELRVESSMQKNILKMTPRDCEVQFGSDLQFKILPTQKFSPEGKDIFIRWTEICKANFNVRFQVRLTRNEVKDKNYEAEYRTVVYLNILKVGANLSTTQEEYFYFYWISGNIFTGRKNWRKNTIKNSEEKSSEDDGFASGSDLASSEAEKTTQSSSVPSPNRSPVAVRTEIIPTSLPGGVLSSKNARIEKKRKRKKAKQTVTTTKPTDKVNALLSNAPQHPEKDGFEVVRRPTQPLPNPKVTTKKQDIPRNPQRQSRPNANHETKGNQTAPSVAGATSARAGFERNAPSASKLKSASSNTGHAVPIAAYGNEPGATKATTSTNKNERNVPSDSRTTGNAGAKHPVKTQHTEGGYGYRNNNRNAHASTDTRGPSITSASGGTGAMHDTRTTSHTGTYDHKVANRQSDANVHSGTSAPGITGTTNPSNPDAKKPPRRQFTGQKDPQKPRYQKGGRTYPNTPPLQNKQRPKYAPRRQPQDTEPNSSSENGIPRSISSSLHPIKTQSNPRNPQPDRVQYPQGYQRPRTNTRDSAASANDDSAKNADGPNRVFDHSLPPKDRRQRPRWNRRKGDAPSQQTAAAKN